MQQALIHLIIIRRLFTLLMLLVGYKDFEKDFSQNLFISLFKQQLLPLLQLPRHPL